MWLTHLTYRLKGSNKVERKSFETFEQAQEFLINEGLQVIVGKLENVEKPWIIVEAAAHKSKAEWFEFSHEYIQ